MLKFMLIFLLPLVSGVRYDNYTLYKLLPRNVEQIKLLQELQHDFRFDFWTEPRISSEFVSILSKPEFRSELETLLNGNEITFEITMSNIQEAIDKEQKGTYSRRNVESMTWTHYYSIDQIYSWIDDLAAAYSEVSVIIGGESYEGRQIKGLKISHGSGRRVIFIEGGIHAREWISPAVCSYLAYALLTSEDELIRNAAREYDWHIFPVTNPDGYFHSFEGGVRMWRKNRRPIGPFFGVDLNRNWNSNWLLVGASTNPQSDVYAGPAPFSEIETRTLSQYIRSIGDEIDIYLSVHSFGQMFLIPFGNTTEPLANYHESLNVGRRAAGALSVRYGTQYVVGNIAEVLYLATGGSDEWVKEHVDVPLVYCVELRDRGTYGFLLPPDQILPSGEETVDGIIDLIYQARRFNVIYSGSSRLYASLVFVFVSLCISLEYTFMFYS